MQVFQSNEFGNIRTVEIDGEPWLVGKDVAEALGYQNPSKALSDHVEPEDKLNNESLLSLGQRGGWLINESGLYSLVLSSKLSNAKKFKRWVTSEVLPSIRKHGAYMTPETLQAAILNPDYLLQVVTALKEETDRRKALETENATLNRHLEAAKPKTLFADSVAAAGTTILIGELAKILRQNGVNMGEKRLFAWMRQEGYLVRRKGTDYNMPTQKAMELGLFQIKETVVNHSSGYTTVNKTPKVTGKGQQYFISKFLAKPAE